MAVQLAPESRPDRRARLAGAVAHAAHLLPAQGPITVFIHHNTLHAFEDLPFDEAVARGAEVFGCEPYLTEARYRAEAARGRIRVDELREVVRAELGAHADDPVVGTATRLDVRLALLAHASESGPAAELDHLMAETGALDRARPDAPESARARLVAETRRWAMRDLRGRSGPGVPAWAAGLFVRAGAGRVERWGDDVWEAVALESL